LGFCRRALFVLNMRAVRMRYCKYFHIDHRGYRWYRHSLCFNFCTITFVINSLLAQRHHFVHSKITIIVQINFARICFSPASAWFGKPRKKDSFLLSSSFPTFSEWKQHSCLTYKKRCSFCLFFRHCLGLGAKSTNYCHRHFWWFVVHIYFEQLLAKAVCLFDLYQQHTTIAAKAIVWKIIAGLKILRIRISGIILNSLRKAVITELTNSCSDNSPLATIPSANPICFSSVLPGSRTWQKLRIAINYAVPAALWGICGRKHPTSFSGCVLRSMKSVSLSFYLWILFSWASNCRYLAMGRETPFLPSTGKRPETAASS